MRGYVSFQIKILYYPGPFVVKRGRPVSSAQLAFVCFRPSVLDLESFLILHAIQYEQYRSLGLDYPLFRYPIVCCTL